MASTYTRKNSAFIWVRFKDERGKWKGKATGYRHDNLGDKRQAELLARKLTDEERSRRPEMQSEHWSAWVLEWLNVTYAGRDNNTLTVYRRHWRHVESWLDANQVGTPSQLRYSHLSDYRDDRLEDGMSINTIIQEVKVLGIIMQEAVRREWATANPTVRLGWKRVRAKEKTPWTDEEFQRACHELEKNGPEWMLVTLLLGFYQAARLRQCAVPLSDINLAGSRITYKRAKGGDAKSFTQPLDRRIVPTLTRIVAGRRAAGHDTLCDIPQIPSVHWRQFLLGLGYGHLCHHGLRVTWITRAAQSGKIAEPLARRFVNHGAGPVHLIYQKLDASDVAHVPDVLNLPETREPAPGAKP